MTVSNEGNLTGGGGTFSNSGNGYYQSTTGPNTLRISKRLASIAAPGSYTANGGVIVRVYYQASDITPMETDPFPSGSLVQSGWFKCSPNTASATVAAMTPTGIAGLQFLTPSASGIENGVNYVEFQMTSFSTIGYYAASSAILPVTLSSWEVNENKCAAVLSWKTSAERNVSHFEPEFSENGTGFTKIGMVPAKNQAAGSYYSYVYQADNIKGFYRLKIVDNNNTFSYTDILNLNAQCKEEEGSIRVYPNVTSDQTTISGLRDGDQVHIYDIYGRMLHHVNVVSHEVNLSLLHYAAGTYIVHVTRENGKATTVKVVKQ